MNSGTGVNRPYHSPARTEAAQRTRAAIVRAATTLFTTAGYGATSVADVAREAGVARATVFNSVGQKPALLRAAYHAAVVGDEGDPRPAREGPLGERARRADTSAEVLDVYATVLVEVFEAVSPLHACLVTSASESPELRGYLAELDRERHRGAANMVALASERGSLAPGLTPERAADIAWVFSNPQLWQQLHGERGWTSNELTDWLRRTLKEQLLGST
ncbi:helix-turn-helix domain-containing protein [Nocardioides sp. QY071]|uniref:TetR/AcrR family transcriptional regulator n=1 Tax=Nocardioides sp. QY071 TaxID=3044187 RepID=UPI00249B1231|nr:helix-turn-helix domain-containing protein [Nocardioides sp. QY071]WGY00352.1 helix-turn-helix domain-containing protein [Nocardioides sp. QY071]